MCRSLLIALCRHADSQVAPALQAREAELKRAQIGVLYPSPFCILLSHGCLLSFRMSSIETSNSENALLTSTRTRPRLRSLISLLSMPMNHATNLRSH